MNKKVLLNLLIASLFLLSGCSHLQKVSNHGNSYIYNGKTYTINSGIGVKKVGKEVGITDDKYDKSRIYEIDGEDSNSWLAIRYQGMVDFAVLKENNAPEFSLESLQVDELQINTIQGAKISIKDQRTIDELMYRFKNAHHRVFVPTGETPPDTLALLSNQSNLTFEFNYFHSSDQNCILEKSNLTREAVEIGDILSKYIDK